MKDTIIFKPVEDVDLFVHHNERGMKRVENATTEEDQYPDGVWP